MLFLVVICLGVILGVALLLPAVVDLVLSLLPQTRCKVALDAKESRPSTRRLVPDGLVLDLMELARTSSACSAPGSRHTEGGAAIERLISGLDGRAPVLRSGAKPETPQGTPAAVQSCVNGSGCCRGRGRRVSLVRCPTRISSSRRLGVAALLMATRNARRALRYSRRLRRACARSDIALLSFHQFLDLRIFEVYLINATRLTVIPTCRSARALRLTSVFLPRSAAEKRCRLAWSYRSRARDSRRSRTMRQMTVTRLDRSGGRLWPGFNSGCPSQPRSWRS